MLEQDTYSPGCRVNFTNPREAGPPSSRGPRAWRIADRDRYVVATKYTLNQLDLSIFDLFVTLSAGASVRLLNGVESMLGPWIARHLSPWRLTHWYSVPAALIAMLQGGLAPRCWPEAKVILFSGEPFPTPKLCELQRALPQARDGRRVELGQVESVIYGCPEVAEAAVVATPCNGSPALVAFVCWRQPGEQGRSQLLGRVKELVPLHMVPARFIFLEALPRTTNGKVDQQLLLEEASRRVTSSGPPNVGHSR